MAQIQAGQTYQTGMAVTAANLNAHVNNASLLPGCIAEQVVAPSVSSTDSILISNGSSLNKTTLASIVSPLGLFDKAQPQTLGQNVTFASGADIALSSGSIMSLSSGAEIALSSGAILTLGQNPASAWQAVPKQYADTNYLSLATGGLVSGSISMIGTSSILTLSADPLSALQAAPKQYVENWGPREIASLRMRTTTAPGTNNTLNTGSYISATINQTGSTSVTVTVSNAALFNTAQPFFLEGQYIGLASGAGSLPARLYKIDSVNAVTTSFVITAPTSATQAGPVQLTVLYANLTPPALPSMLDANGNKNIKSVFLCLASNKVYINYWYDTETGLMTGTPTTPTTISSTTIVGDAVTGSTTNTSQFLTALQMRQFASTVLTQPYAAAQPTGFGLTSKGAHVGFFADTTTGCPLTYLHDSNVLILR